MIYLDHASTTPLCQVAKLAIVNHLDDYGNPSSNHELGRNSRILIEEARQIIAKCINAEPYEIYFTSGASESNSWALNEKHHVITTPIEHHSVRGTKIIPVSSDGIVDIERTQQSIAKYIDMLWSPIDIISCGMINNELGVIQPVHQLAKIAHDNGMYFHTDATQAVGNFPVDVQSIECDMLSASAHKFYGPKGVGILYIKEGVNLPNLIYGGHQERGMRPGTENTLGIVAMAMALEDAVRYMDARIEYVRTLNARMLDKLLKIGGSHINGSMQHRTTSNINIRFDRVRGSTLVSLASLYGVCISTGSACNAGIAEPSHVLKAIGLTNKEALSSIRITLGHNNTIEEIDEAADIITHLVQRIREENP